MDVVTGEFGVVNSAVGITTSKVKLNGSSGLVTGTGFSKTGATDAHVLLGSGGHKSISDFNASLVTSTTTSGTTNVATSNTNTYLNIVQGGSSVGSSTQIMGSNGVSVSSNTSGRVTIVGVGDFRDYGLGSYGKVVSDSNTEESIFGQEGVNSIIRVIRSKNSTGFELINSYLDDELYFRRFRSSAGG